jgi:WD40 repeat protein
MHDPEQSFSPLLIDQQIERPTDLLAREEAHLVHHLQAMYDQENNDAIDRVWIRLGLQQSRYAASSHPEQPSVRISTPVLQEAQGIQRQHKVRQASAFARRLSPLVAVLVVALLLGSLAFAFMLSRGGSAFGWPGSSTASWGRIVSAQTMHDAGFNGLSWSPDSKRIAASTRMSSGNSVRIWDATNGQHLVTVSIPAFVDTLAWSPDSEQVAVATNQNIFIVDGQSGQVVRTLPVPAPSQSFTPAKTGLIPLSIFLPGSGGSGLRGLSWSPDGGHLAATFFGSPSGSSVLIWDPGTGTLSRLPVQRNQGVEGGVSWSSDGNYLAADTFQMAATDPLVQSGVTVWSVATHRVVLQKPTGSLPDLNTMLAWQPGTHTLAQIGVVKVGGKYMSALLIFDGVNGQMRKELTVPISDVLSWSPDGKYLAYVAPVDLTKGNTATILKVSNWRVVYVYKAGHNLLNALSWSPDGHYIATGETVLENNSYIGVVKVWVALDRA